MTTSTRSVFLAALAAAFVLPGLVSAAGAGMGENSAPLFDGPSASTVVTPDGGWQPFNWDNPAPSPVNENPLTYDAGGVSMLRVTDAFCYGDRFDVAVSPGLASPTTTTTTPPGSTACGGPVDPDAAWADPLMSKGCWFVEPGAQSVDIWVIEGTLAPGTGYLRVDSVDARPDLVDECETFGDGVTPPVPELGTLGLVGVGVLGVAALVLRRK